MPTPRPDTASIASGAALWAGRDSPGIQLDPDLTTATWPPATTCTIPAVAGVNAPIHPSVVDFAGVVGGDAWNGYRYWMAFTPYPTSNDDTVENPSIVASNDGTTWVAPATNPIEPAPSGAATGFLYNADTQLVYVGGTLYMFWLLSSNTSSYGGTRTTTIYVRTSTDGVTWTEKQQVLQEVTVTYVGLLSPSIEYKAGEWWLWTYSSQSDPISCYLRKASIPTGPWSSPVLCSLTLPDSAREPWHFDVNQTPFGWAMLISDRNRSNDTKGRLWFAYADAEGIDWAVRATPFSTASPNVYRSTFVPNAGGHDCWVTDWDARLIKRLRIEDSQL